MKESSHFKPRIVVESESSRWWGRAERLFIILDGQKIGTIRPGQQQVFFIDLGSHQLQMKAGRRVSEVVTFRAQEGDCLNFRCVVSGHLRKSVELTPLFRRRHAAPRFNLSGLPRYGRRHSDHLPWHEALGVSSHASLAEIERAYEEKMRDYAPHRIASLNDDDAERKYALNQVKKLHTAYAEAKARRS
jgi:hypothetical protein